MSVEKRGWFEERLQLKQTLDWFLHRKVPRGVGWWYVLGSGTMVVFIILVATGIFLMLNYSPSPDHAYDSVQYIMREVPFGNLIRSIHFYAASAMVILIGLHLLRVYFMAAYKYPRELTWITGTLLFLLVMGSSFTGYLLPWDQRAYWATNVAAGIAGEVPLIGSWIQRVLIGGNQIGTLALTRFFTFHVGVLPILTGLLIGFHIFMVIRQGISAPPGLMRPVPLSKKDRKAAYEEQYEASKKGGEAFFPETVARDSIFALLIVAVIIILATVFPHLSEAPADPTSTSYNPRPEWYFFFFFEFLRLFPGWLEAGAAVIIPLVAVLILFAVPFLDRSIDRFWTQRKKGLAIGSLAVLVFATLEVSGAISAPTRPSSESNQLVMEGQKVYRDVNCGYCHSINGVGGAVGPDLSNIASILSVEQMAQYLSNPDSMVPNTLHPKLQFTPAELQAIVAYLETLGASIVSTPQAPQLFAQNCSICHAINGQGGTAGPDLSREGSLRSIDFLQSFISDPKTVFPQASMPGFHNVLTPAQIKDIAVYLSTFKGQAPSPSPTPAPTPTLTPTPPPITTPPPTSPPPTTPPPTSPPPTTPPPTSPPPTTPVPTSPPAINAAQLYNTYCASCHGSNRQGGRAPPLTAAALARRTVSQIANLIVRGTSGMPGFSSQMSPEQISALSNYLKQ